MLGRVELIPPRLGLEGRVLLPLPNPEPTPGRLNEPPGVEGRDGIDGGLTLGRVEGRAEGILGRVEGRTEGVLGREGSVLGLDSPPIEGRLEGRLTEGLLTDGRLTEGLEALENDGRELGLDPLGRDMLGRDGLGRETLGFAPPERPIDGREPPEGRDILAPPPPLRPPRPCWASDVSGASRQIAAVSAKRLIAKRIFLLMIGHLSGMQEVNSISLSRLGRLAYDGGLKIGLDGVAEHSVKAFHEKPVFTDRFDEDCCRSGRSVR